MSLVVTGATGFIGKRLVKRLKDDGEAVRCLVRSSSRTEELEALGAEVVVVDFGTATNFDVVADDGAYVGGVIAPGVNLSLEALHSGAAALPHVDITQPDKVIGFLQVTGDWDPSLLFVMGSALLVYGIGLQVLVRRRERPVYAKRFGIPTRRDLTPRLAIGATLFGAGWGLAGYCPGPAIASLPTGTAAPLAFVAAMLAGMLAFRAWDVLAQRRAAAALQLQEVEA